MVTMHLDSATVRTPTVAYDANGNTLSDASGRSFTWDFENRLTQVVNPGVGTTTFRYDPFGRRIQKPGPLGSTNYLYDGDNSIVETDQSGNILARYAQGKNLDEPLAQLRSGAASYYHGDAIGSVTSLSTSAGALANTYTYDAFGNLTASTGTVANPFQFTTRDYDSETGLRYYRARYYDGRTGRFISEDPTRFNSKQADFYTYAGNSPVLNIDPSGLALCILTYLGNGNAWMYCLPDDPRNSGTLSFPVASGNNRVPGCKNNPRCAPKSHVGPIPLGWWYWTGEEGSGHYSRRLLPVPNTGTNHEHRNNIESHWCAYPFGPSLKPPYCSAGCITADQDDISRLNYLIDSEPGSEIYVTTGDQ